MIPSSTLIEPIKTLLLYATKDGQTEKVCRHLHEILGKYNHRVEILPLEQASSALSAYDKVILAAPVRYGVHLPSMIAFVQAHEAELNRLPSVFVSVNLVARKQEKRTPETNPYVQKFLEGTSWKPCLTGVFAGVLNYRLYPFLDRWMIRLIMLLTGGPLRTPQPLEYTDWKAVEAFGVQIAGLPVSREASSGVIEEEPSIHSY